MKARGRCRGEVVEQELRLKSRKRGKDHKPGRGVAVHTGGLPLPSCHQGPLLAPDMRQLFLVTALRGAHRPARGRLLRGVPPSFSLEQRPWTRGLQDRCPPPHVSAPHRVQGGRVKLFLPPANHRPCLGPFVGYGDVPPFNHSFT